MFKRGLTLAAILALAVVFVAADHSDAQQAGRKKGERAGTRKRFGRRRAGFRGRDRLKVGDVAPEFTLKSLDGKKTVTLSNFQGKKPVLLVFGSYT